jgi:hypothetical protein
MNNYPVLRISLTGDQFRKLVMGDIVRIEGVRGIQGGMDIPDVEICLQDMSFTIMREHIVAAEREERFGV